MSLPKSIALCLLVVGLIVGCSRNKSSTSNEPTYQGRKITEWIPDLDNNSQPQVQAMAAEAMRHIGPPAVPFLLEQLSVEKARQFKAKEQRWNEDQVNAEIPVPRPPNPRSEALAGLDALGFAAASALPELKKLVQGDQPDVRALYVAARMGPDGVPLLASSLTNQLKVVRLAAQVCLDMIYTRSEVLYPKIPVGPAAPSFNRRICEFNLKILQASFCEYKAEHPESFFPDDNLNALPSPARPQ